MSALEQLKDRSSQYQEKLISHPQVQAGVNWYLGLNERDRTIVRLVGFLLILALVFVLIYAPLIKQNQKLEQKVEKRMAFYELMAENAHKFGGAQAKSTEGSILPIVSSSARQGGITLERYEREGDGLRVWLSAVSFDDFISWTERLLSGYGIRATQVTVDAASGAGRVDVRITLMPSGG